MNCFKYGCVSLFLVLLLPAGSYAENRVAVLNFATNMPAAKRDQFQDELVSYLNRKGIATFDVSGRFIKKLFKQFYRHKLTSKDDLVAIGHRVNARFLVWGNIEKTKAAVYSVTVQVLDVRDQKFIYSKKVESDSFKESFAHIPVFSVDVAERIFYRQSDRYPHNVSLHYTYFSADNSFKGMISNGHGYGLWYDYSFLSTSLMAGLDAQYFYVDGNKQNTDHARVIPCTVHAGYALSFWRILVIPQVHIGTIYNSNYYYNNEGKSSYSAKNSFLLLGKCSMRLNIVIYDPMTLIFGYEWGIFKEKTYKSYRAFYTGLQISFW